MLIKYDLIVVGGGAAGFFGAINYAEANPEASVIILEKGAKVLSKVKVSGGGRCNVTNAVNDPLELSKYYPRGGKELIGPFNRFSTNHMVDWLQSRGVLLKTEADNRIFPITDDSQTIIDCFLKEADKLRIKIATKKNVINFYKKNFKWTVETADKEIYESENLLLTAGSSERTWNILKSMGHKIDSPVPSLFTFNIKDKRLTDLSGLSIPVSEIKIEGTNLKEKGPILITHWGLSGPAVLKLSSRSAIELHKMKYNFNIRINFINKTTAQALEYLNSIKNSTPQKNPVSHSLFNIPNRLWERLILSAGLNNETRWNDVSKKQLVGIAEELTNSSFTVIGKSTFKEEFVTCGGVNLSEVNFKTMESKIIPALFFAGELLNIDALTGGFNFQAAWTTAYIAGISI